MEETTLNTEGIGLENNKEDFRMEYSVNHFAKMRRDNLVHFLLLIPFDSLDADIAYAMYRDMECFENEMLAYIRSSLVSKEEKDAR